MKQQDNAYHIIISYEDVFAVDEILSWNIGN